MNGLVSVASENEMTGQFFFTAIAGLALSIAGFGALVATFRRDAAWSRTEIWRLRSIVRLGFVCMFLALAPLPLYYAVAGDEMLAIRLSSLLVVIAEVWEVRGAVGERHEWQSRDWVRRYIVVGASQVAFSLLNVAIGSVWLLMIGLLIRLSHPAQLFVRVLRDFQPPIADE
ncbi:MAG: hypothetical protein AUH85_02665 [Chloroflexi bacterium 13_1_40CM_4_68_4]|nr:MAG: hypothetical protein AUH85_02665 [Chloroflexi bacterium 13_1_40CM_4_68_4]